MRFLQIGTTSWKDQLDLREDDEWFFLQSDTTDIAAATLEDRVIIYEDEEVEEELNESAEELTQEENESELDTTETDLASEESEDVTPATKKPKRPTHVTVTQFIGSMTAILIDSPEGISLLEQLKDDVQPYTIFYHETIDATTFPKWLTLYGPFPVDMTDQEALYRTLTKALFNGQYGDKMSVAEFTLQPTFKGTVTQNSLSHLSVEGDFGQDFRPVGSWKMNRVNFAGLTLELWFEHMASEGLELQLRVRQIQEGSIDSLISEVVYSQEQMQEAMVLEDTNNGYVAVSLEAKGQGTITIGVLHVRWSRMGFGKFLVGGGIVSDAQKDEINYYFHPGDMKPPLCVYFSGFRSAEGFEGYWMMKNMKTPFLLISDQRLVGGAFYMGSDELEDKVRGVIQEKLDALGFTNQDLIFSGLSMGTYGSLYYAADFSPRAVIIGKALANLGNMAVLNKTFSPSSFAASLYVLRKHTGGLSETHVAELQDRFWNKFTKGYYKDTTFGIVYMKEDDYDPTAYPDIVSNLYQSQTQIIGKGLSGRHGDSIDAAVHWFLTYYRHIFERDFGRK